MQCPDCGAHFVKEDEFCGECGRRLSWETAGDSTDDKAWVADPDSLEDLAGDLFEPPPPEPALVETKPDKSNLRTIVIVVGLALLMLCLCAGGAIAWWIFNEESVAVPPTSVMAEPGALLYEENFDDPGSGWSTFDGDETAVSYEDGGYRMTINRTEYMVWGNPEPALDFADLLIEVDVRQVEGPLDNNFGVLVRYLEDDEQHSYYWFQISADGFYSVDFKLEDEWIPLVGWEASTAINTGLGITNRIRVECSGGQFSFYTNDVHLVDVSDGTIGSGSIGLGAGTFEEPGVVVQFDDLRVYELGE
jgi:hypothetical protein